MPTPTPDAARVDMEFDFDDFHCTFDVDELLGALTPVGAAAVLADTARADLDGLDDYDWRELATRITADADETHEEALEEAADTIRDTLHPDGCDCAVLNHQWFLETADEMAGAALDGPYLMGLYRDADRRYGPDHVTSSFSLTALRDALKVDSYDRVTLTLDPDTRTGEVCWYDRGGSTSYDIVWLRDPDRIQLTDTFDEQPVADIAELSDDDVTLYLALAAAAIPDPTHTDEDRFAAPTLDELDWESLRAAVDAFGGTSRLTLAVVDQMTDLAPTWSGTSRQLLDALHATAA